MSAPAQVELEVFTDFVCPWCYLGAARTARLARAFDLRVRHRMFPLHPETPAQGRALTELFGGRRDVIDDMWRRLVPLLDAEGLPYADRTHTYNSRRAQELAKWAERRGDGPAVHDALYRAYFVAGRNLAEVDVLVGIVTDLGLPPDEAAESLRSGAEREAVDRDWARAHELGVTGVPTYRAGGLTVAGAQPWSVLVELVTAAGASPRADA